MKFLEKDLEDIIWESNNEKLNERGLPIGGKKFRQFKIGNYGVSDLITVEKDYIDFEKTHPYLVITVFELKKDKIGISAFFQSMKYCKGIKTYLDYKYPNLDFIINVVLSAKEIDKTGEFIYITDLIRSYENFGFINNIDFYTFDYTIDGIEFKHEKEYNLTYNGLNYE